MMTRLEGVGSITTMVLDGPSMDALVKKLCINANTTVVFVASKNQNALNVSRAYFTFRYWGFPKARLKVLNGGENGWENAIAANNWPASYAPTTAVPSLTPSTFSIKTLYVNNGSTTANFALRASIGDMLGVVDRINNGTQLTDATGVAIMDDRGGNPAVFIQNAIIDDFAQYTLSGAGNTSTFKPTSELDRAAQRLQRHRSEVADLRVLRLGRARLGHLLRARRHPRLECLPVRRLLEPVELLRLRSDHQSGRDRLADRCEHGRHDHQPDVRRDRHGRYQRCRRSHLQRDVLRHRSSRQPDPERGQGLLHQQWLVGAGHGRWWWWLERLLSLTD
jgi:hypothetical protein